MKLRYRLFLRRKSVYYAFDNATKTFESLKTKDKAEAAGLVLALNTGKAAHQPYAPYTNPGRSACSRLESGLGAIPFVLAQPASL